MPDLIFQLSQYLDYFPLVALFGLLLAGLNLPVSEDLIIITGAILCHKKPSLLPATLAAIYLGAISTDYFVYWVGRRVRSGTAKISFFTKLVPEKALDKMQYYLNKYGIFTFIVCRFIPFGVRNTLFFTVGFSKLRFRYFAIYEGIAAMCSINTLFFLTYKFGDIVKKPIKIAGIILFIVFVSGIISLIIRLIVMWHRKIKSPKQSGEATPGA